MGPVRPLKRLRSPRLQSTSATPIMLSIPVDAVFV